MKHIYQIGIRVYYFVAVLVSHFYHRAKKWVDGVNQNSILQAQIEKTSIKRIWFHISSLGEYEQAKELIFFFEKTNEVVISFFSPSGYEIVQKKKHT